MTTIVTIDAHVSAEKQVKVLVGDSNTGIVMEIQTLQDGQHTQVYVYDNRTLSVHEEVKKESLVSNVPDMPENGDFLGDLNTAVGVGIAAAADNLGEGGYGTAIGEALAVDVGASDVGSVADEQSSDRVDDDHVAAAAEPLAGSVTEV